MSNDEEESFNWLEVDLSDLTFLFRRHIRILIALPFLAGAAAVVLAKVLPPVFATEALFSVRPNFDQDLGVEHSNIKLEDGDSLRSVAQTLVSSPVILRMIDRLDLRNNPDYLPALKKGKPLSDLQIIKEVKDRYQTKLRATTRLIELRVEDYDPERAVAISRILSEEFLEQIREDRIAKRNDIRATLVKQAEITLQHALVSEERLKQFRLEHPETLMEQDSHVFHERILEQSTAMNVANSESLRLEGTLKALEEINAEADPHRVFQILNQKENNYLSDLLTMEAGARSAMAVAQEKFTPTHSEYQAALSRMSDTDRSVRKYAVELKNSVNSEYLAASEKAKRLEDQVEKLREKFIAFKTTSAGFRGIKEEIDRNWNTHTQLQQRIMQLDLDPEAAPTFLTVVEPPLLPHKKAKPWTILWALAGLVFGSFTALALVLWKNRQGLPFTSGKQSENLLSGIRQISEIKFPSVTRDDQIVAQLEKSNPLREMLIACREARIVHLTGILQSPSAGLISFSFARTSGQFGSNTLLIRLGKDEPQSHISPPKDGLSILNLCPNVLFDCNAFNHGLESLKNRYDRIVIDSTQIEEEEGKLAISELSSTTIIAVEGEGEKRRSHYKAFADEIKARDPFAMGVYISPGPGLPKQKRNTPLKALPGDKLSSPFSQIAKA